MTDVNLINLINIITESSENTNKEMNFIKKYLENVSDRNIRIYYKEKREGLFEEMKQILKGFKERIPRNIESTDNLLNENLTRNHLNREQIDKLEKSKELDKESLTIIDEIQKKIKYIMDHRLNTAIIGNLRYLTLQTIKEHDIKPRDDVEREIIRIVERELSNQHNKGGLRKSRKNHKKKNKTNKKHTKRRTLKSYK